MLSNETCERSCNDFQESPSYKTSYLSCNSLQNDSSEIKEQGNYYLKNIGFSFGLLEFASLGFEIKVNDKFNIGFSYSGQAVGRTKKENNILTAIAGLDLSLIYCFKELDLPECLFDFNYVTLKTKLLNDFLAGSDRGFCGPGFELLVGYKSREKGLRAFYGLGVSYSHVSNCYDIGGPVLKFGLAYNFR